MNGGDTSREAKACCDLRRQGSGTTANTVPRPQPWSVGSITQPWQSHENAEGSKTGDLGNVWQSSLDPAILLYWKESMTNVNQQNQEELNPKTMCNGKRLGMIQKPVSRGPGWLSKQTDAHTGSKGEATKGQGHLSSATANPVK